ncbi:MAG TPA: hypothetical protein VI424_04305 [Terriglobales bacterium]|jgi:hypothetical protein
MNARQLQREPVRTVLIKTYIGPIATALLVGAGLQGLIRAARVPLETVVPDAVNFLLLHTGFYYLSITEQQFSPAMMAWLGAPGVIFLVSGLCLGLWLYRPSDFHPLSQPDNKNPR